MDTAVFWNVIGEYNRNTFIIQQIIFVLIIVSYFISSKGKIKNLIKITLGITNLYIGIVFFGFYGSEAIQKYFALPLYILVGCLFLYEAFINKSDLLTKPDIGQILLFIFFVLYPIISYFLGNKYPRMVVYVMPCPIVALSIAIYSGYTKKNIFLMILLTIWGLTGIKSIFFEVYEDIILLFAGLYGGFQIVKQLATTST